MIVLGFFLELMSGAMLLLFSVRFLRIGIERLWSSRIHSSFDESSSLIGKLVRGSVLGFGMQGATVVLLLVAGLAGSGSLSVSSATAVALGADLGSAFAVQFLQLPVSAIGPFAILLGATMYLRSPNTRHRNYGRLLLGLGLVFLSLGVIRQAVAPLSHVEGIDWAIDYINGDVITSALLGVLLTFLMHSSVAALLTAIALASQLSLATTSGLMFMLGCNIGSSLLPLWLLKHESNYAPKHVAYSVATIRCGVALVAIALLLVFETVSQQFVGIAASEAILVGHIVFNLTLMLFAPLCSFVAKFFESDTPQPMLGNESALAAALSDETAVDLSSYKRHVSGMLETASEMFENSTNVPLEDESIKELEKSLNRALAQLREAFSRTPDIETDELSKLQRIIDFAIRIERCGDTISGKYQTLKKEQFNGEFRFSKSGHAEIQQLVIEIRRGFAMAQEVLWTNDLSMAHSLVRHKQTVASMEAESRSKHLDRLRKGDLDSQGSSDQHLETIAALKEINSKLATIGYAVLDDRGALKSSRLKKTALQVSST